MRTDRRSFVLALTSAGLLSRFGSVIAGGKDPYVAKSLETNSESARVLLARVAKLGDKVDNKAAAAFMKEETSLRNQLWKSLSSVPSTQLIDYVMPERRELVTAMQKADVALLPGPTEIRPADVKSVPPPAKCGETLISVLVDIMLEGLELQVIKEAITKVIEQTPDLQKMLNDLAKAVQLRDSKQVIDLLAKILEYFSKIGMLDLLINALGPDKAKLVWRSLLKKLGEKFVPFVGQLYTLISVATALFNNSPRLLAAIKCASK